MSALGAAVSDSHHLYFYFFIFLILLLFRMSALGAAVSESQLAISNTLATR